MIATVHSIYSQSVHAPALDAGSMTLSGTVSYILAVNTIIMLNQ